MTDVTRRGMFGLVPGVGALLFSASMAPTVSAAEALPVQRTAAVTSFNWARMESFRRGVVAEVGQDLFECWFRGIEMERLEDGKLTVSVPVVFLKRWQQEHYARPLLRGAQRMDASVEEVKIVVRRPQTKPLQSRAIA